MTNACPTTAAVPASHVGEAVLSLTDAFRGVISVAWVWECHKHLGKTLLSETTIVDHLHRHKMQ